jgi:hypothetical protein
LNNANTAHTYIRWLHHSDQRREQGANGEDGSGFTEEEHDPAPEPRTHAETIRQGRQAEDYVGPKENHPRKQSGINGWCPLGVVPLFDLIWDVCPDFMHIIKNYFERFFDQVPAGKRIPFTTKQAEPVPRTENYRAKQKAYIKAVGGSPRTADYATRKIAYDRDVARQVESRKRALECKLTAVEQAQIDIRCRKLAKESATGIPFSMVPFSTLPGHGHQKAAAWVKLLRFYVPYLLHGMGTKHTHDALMRMTDVLREILDTTCDYTPDDEDSSAAALTKCNKLKRRIINALVCMEARLPASDLSYFMHEVVHMGDFTYRWNNVRNYWCFITERFVGYVKGFVKNRHLALENLVRNTQKAHIVVWGAVVVYICANMENYWCLIVV